MVGFKREAGGLRRLGGLTVAGEGTTTPIICPSADDDSACRRHGGGRVRVTGGVTGGWLAAGRGGHECAA